MTRPRKPSSGFVYFVASPFGTTKIGCTRNLRRRMELYTHCELLHTIPASDPRRLEMVLHAHFGPKRVRGEWFNLNAEDISYVRSFSFEQDVFKALSEASALPRRLEFYTGDEWYRRLVLCAKRVRLCPSEYVRRAVDKVMTLEDELYEGC